MSAYGSTKDVESNDFASESLAGGTDDGKPSWVRVHWCWIVRIILAVIGIMVPLIMFLQPCEDKIVTTYEIVKQPVNLFILLDGSGSMQQGNRWPNQIIAAKNITRTFINADISSLQVGLGQFSTYGHVEHGFTNDTDAILTAMDNLYLRRGSTYYSRGLEAYLGAWQTRADTYENEFSLLVFISDGAPNDYKRGPTTARKIRSDYNISIATIMVADDEDEQYIQRVSSCDGVDSNSMNTCPYFMSFDDFDTFVQKAGYIADALEDQIGNVIHEKESVKCVKAPWLGFLALLIPLLALMIMPFCVHTKKVYKRRVTKQVPVAKMPPPPPRTSSGPPPPPPASQPGAPRKSKFRWEIKAHDQYLWGSNATPMKVSWGKSAAPPSAPRDPNCPARKIMIINSVDTGDGYVEEEVCEDRTLEQWTEDAATNTVHNIQRVFCCCFRNGYDRQVDDEELWEEKL